MTHLKNCSLCQHCSIFLVAFLCMLLTGCTTTKAQVKATGVHMISAYGVLSFGSIDYRREADPETTPPAKPFAFEDFLCTATPKDGQLVLHCGTYPSWERYIKEQQEKGSL